MFESPVFEAKSWFGGNRNYVPTTDVTNPFNFTGLTGGGCVGDGPFTDRISWLIFLVRLSV